MKNRKKWEEDFTCQVLLPVFEQADEVIDNARKLCWANQTQSNLERYVIKLIEIDLVFAKKAEKNLGQKHKVVFRG